MEYADRDIKSNAVNISDDNDPRSAVNTLILDYYKKFGKKRDLEQYFSLSTAQSDLRDPSSLFWTRMKAQNDSSDSGERKSESSAELCRISIKCSVPESTSSQDENRNSNESESPPIVTEYEEQVGPKHSDDESVKSEDDQSHKSFDVALDTSKQLSPTSSVTSQRKLEWDSLADVGYGNESDKKTSASSLSTLERLALQQHYSNSDTKQESIIGTPTAHSTIQNLKDSNNKVQEGPTRKTTKIYKKDIDLVELNLPHTSNETQAIHVNLTKHISFNVEKDEVATIKDFNTYVTSETTVQPEKVIAGNKINTDEKNDKEMQTSLKNNNGQSASALNTTQCCTNKIPVLISLNTIKRRNRRNKVRAIRKKLKNKKEIKPRKAHELDKSGDQLSEAESFEYLPGHMYNQNKLLEAESQHSHFATNKSSHESSGATTTDSSKTSNYSFAKDLEKCVHLLKTALQRRYKDSSHKKSLIKEVVQRLIESRYKDDESTTDFLSGLSFDSKKIGLSDSNYTTSSTSDAPNTSEKIMATRPKKSILRIEKLNANGLSFSTQSAPNLPSPDHQRSNTLLENTASKFYVGETDASYKQRKSDNNITKTSSEEIYKKYIQALEIEESYRKYLNDDKNKIWRHRLVNSETTLKEPKQAPVKSDPRLTELLNDLVRNDYDDGSGDASKLKIGSSADLDKYSSLLKQRNHSIFTLSSCNSDSQNKKGNLKKKSKHECTESHNAGCSKQDNHCCFCPYHSTAAKLDVTDSSVQVNLKYQCDQFSIGEDLNKQAHIHLPHVVERNNRVYTNTMPDHVTQMKCLCYKKSLAAQEMQENILIYKCPCLSDKLSQKMPYNTSSTASIKCGKDIESHKPHLNVDEIHIDNVNRCGTTKVNPCILESKKVTKSSQTDIHSNLLILQHKISDRTMASWSSDDKKLRELSLKRGLSGSTVNLLNDFPSGNSNFIYECTRCIQTEISINPRISNPSLTDINLISDAECVQLINGDIQKCKTCSSAGCSHLESKNKCGSKSFTESNWSENISLSRKYSNTDLISKNTKLEICGDQFRRHDTVKLKKTSENFTIPIQGTNMTLMVSIGSNPSYPTETKKELCSQGVVTDKYSLIDRGTCLTDECSKAVQSEITNIFPDITICQSYRSNQDDSQNVKCVSEISICDQNIHHEDTQNKSYQVNSCLTEKPKFNTYPKTEPVNSQKQWPRLNTERGSIGCSQTINNDGNNLEYHQNSSNNSSKGCKQKENALHQCKKNHDKSSGVCRSKYNTAKESSEFEHETSVNYEGCTPNPVKINTEKNKNAMPNSEVKDQCQPKDTVHSPMIFSSDECCEKTKKKKDKQQNINNTVSTDHCRQNLETDLDKLKTCGTANYEIPKTNNSKVNDCLSNLATNMETQRTLPKTLKLAEDQKQPDEYGNCATVSTNTEKQVSPSLSNVQLCCTASNADGQRIEGQGERIEGQVKSVDKAEMCTKSSKKDMGTQKDTDTEQKPTKLPRCKLIDKNLVEERNKNCNNNLNKATNTDIDSKKSKCWPMKSQDDQKDNCSTHTKIEPNKHKYCSSSKLRGTKNAVLLKILETNNIDFKHCEPKDPILDLIQDITNRYNKKDMEKSKRKKCFKEIINVLGYLLDTEESTDNNHCKTSGSSTVCHSNDKSGMKKMKEKNCCSQEALQTKKLKGQGVCTETHNTESSDISISTEISGTSSDSATCKVLNKIKKECEKYYQKRCKTCHSGTKKCEVSSSTSVNCDRCNRVHHCLCRGHRCKGHRGKSNVDQLNKKCVAYNLIIQTSDSVMNEETICTKKNRPLKSVIVKIPPKRKHIECLPFKEVLSKIEKRPIYCNEPCSSKSHQHRGLTNESEISSIDECNRKTQGYTLREYLEKNRPDFIDQTSKRQVCLKSINECRNEDPSATPCLKMVVIHPPACMGCNPMENICRRGLPLRCNPCMQPCMPTVQGEVTTIGETNDRVAQRKLLSLQLDRLSTLREASESQLRRLAKEFGIELRRKKTEPKFISEREMKKHSERIYKSLPEVQQKKEELKKEKIKKSNLLMAELFKRNLQKKTLRGTVNLSNYSTVVKI